MSVSVSQLSPGIVGPLVSLSLGLPGPLGDEVVHFINLGGVNIQQLQIYIVGKLWLNAVFKLNVVSIWQLLGRQNET